MNEDFEKMVGVVSDNDRLCETCIYQDGCAGGVTGGPNGPTYPPCCDDEPQDYIG